MSRPANLLEVDGAACRELIREHPLVLVDFWAEWCAPCRALEPVVAELAAKHPELTVVKVNLEQDRPLGDDYAVRSLPCLLLFKDGEPAERFVGRAPYVILERGLAKHL